MATFASQYWTSASSSSNIYVYRDPQPYNDYNQVGEPEPQKITPKITKPEQWLKSRVKEICDLAKPEW